MRSYHGYLSEVHIVNDAVLAPTSFGEFYNGIWITKRYTGSGTYQYIWNISKLSDSSNFGLDSSGNSNNYTASGFGTEDVHKEEPQNSFASAVENPNLTDDR